MKTMMKYSDIAKMKPSELLNYSIRVEERYGHLLEEIKQLTMKAHKFHYDYHNDAKWLPMRKELMNTYEEMKMIRKVQEHRPLFADISPYEKKIVDEMILELGAEKYKEILARCIGFREVRVVDVIPNKYEKQMRTNKNANI